MSRSTTAAVLLSLSPACLMAQAPAPAAAAPSGPQVASLQIMPKERSMRARDTMRLTVRALDASGNVVPDATIRFGSAGGYFEGVVQPDGLIRSGSTGTLPVMVSATQVGRRPVIERLEIKMVPGPAHHIAVSTSVPTLAVGQRMRYAALSYDEGNEKREERVLWASSNPRVVSVTRDGLASALAAGSATLTATAGSATQTVPVTVSARRIATLDVSPSTADARTGDVIRFTARPKDAAGRAIEGLSPTWSFSPGQGVIGADGAFVGYEAGTYTVTASFGAQTAEATVTLSARDVRRPLEVVGRSAKKRFTTEEVWLHPNGKVAYLGSGSGGDLFYTLDISNPANPIVSDSMVLNTRRVNDLMTNAEGTILVNTREGASDRKNGIVISSLADPLHPVKIAEFTEGMTAGVHSAFVYTQPKFGTHVYATNDGTGAFHIIDITDPYKPKQVAEWRTPRPDAGRSLHDVDVQDGLAYLSYWNDGLVILDVGNGIKGGSPSNPVMVSQYKYDLNDLYRQVELAGGPGFIRGTHTAWRHKNYVFIADEVFPSSGVQGAKDASAGRAYGRLQVIDFSDYANPKQVAFYEPEFGGVHNIWIAGDTLYMGAYNAGFRTFDISGELRGDLRAQQREMAHLNTADMEGFVKNSAMTWGVVVRDGLAYVNDMYNGLWIVRMKPKRGITP
ncbi:MAG TPA: Ig-like domain-containing protein [Gemmatimonadaceae bacterium]|nr:Ig-like domain-containing protein [Gemmatimonadaceae bacterium]